MSKTKTKTQTVKDFGNHLAYDVTGWEDEKVQAFRLKQGVGASEISTLLCLDSYDSELHKWKTPVDLFNLKTGRTKNTIDNFILKFGRDIEPIIAKWFFEQTGKKSNPDNYIRVLRSNPYVFASLDYGIGDEAHPVPHEIKTTSQGRWIAYQKQNGNTDQPDWQPYLENYVQCQQQMYVTGADHAYISYLILGDYSRDLHHIRIEADIDVFEAIDAAAKSFMDNHVKTGVEPPLLTYEDVKSIYPQDNGDLKPAEEIDIDLIQEYEQLNEKVKQLEKRKAEIKDYLSAKIGSELGLSYRGQPLVTLKTVKRAASFSDECTFRQFRVKGF